jgi:hypothetical protein
MVEILMRATNDIRGSQPAVGDFEYGSASSQIA